MDSRRQNIHSREELRGNLEDDTNHFGNLLQASNTFSTVCSVDWSDVLVGSRVRRYESRSPIYLPDEKAENLYYVVDGRVVLGHVSEIGKRHWLTFVEPGEFFGELALTVATDSLYYEFSEAIDSSRILQICARHVRRLMTLNASLASAVSKLIGERMLLMHKSWTQQFDSKTRDRLIRCLLNLVDRYGRPTDEGVELNINLSHEDIAAIVGCSRESVSLELAQLRADGYVAISRRKLCLLKFHDWQDLLATLDLKSPRA